MKTAILKYLDGSLGTMLVAMLPKPSPPRTHIPHRVLVIRPGGIGDAVLLIPALNALHRAYPSCTIDILAEKRNAAAFCLTPDIRTVYRYDTSMGLVAALRNSYDVVIDTEQWHRLSAAAARLTSAPIKIGFDTNERRRMFTHAVEYDRYAYEADNFFALLKPLGLECQRDDETDAVLLPLESISRADQLLQPLASEQFITLFPGASTPEKQWSAARFRSVVKTLSAFGVTVVVIGGKEDRQLGEVIAGDGVGLNLAGMTSLAETAAVIRKSALLVSGDSGVLHIAAGLGVPTVALFGPGSIPKWAPQGKRHLVINRELPCSPCTVFGTTPPCPDNFRCMKDIPVDEVVNAVTMLLTSVGAMSSRSCKRDWIETTRMP